MNEEDGSLGLSEAQVRKILHDHVNREQTRTSLRKVTEQVICEFADVPYDGVSFSHRAVMQARGKAIARVMAEQKASDDRRELRADWFKSGFKTLWDKTISTVAGILLLLGLGWIAAKLGIKLPGAG